MTMTMEKLVKEAREQITAIEPENACSDGGLILDVREPDELSENGRISNALHIPRGVLESRADPDSPAANEALVSARSGAQVHVLCASGARAAMAALTLNRMGYQADVIEGGLQGWKEENLPVDH